MERVMRLAEALAGELSMVSKEDLTSRRGHAVARLVRLVPDSAA